MFYRTQRFNVALTKPSPIISVLSSPPSVYHTTTNFFRNIVMFLYHLCLAFLWFLRVTSAKIPKQNINFCFYKGSKYSSKKETDQLFISHLRKEITSIVACNYIIGTHVINNKCTVGLYVDISSSLFAMLYPIIGINLQCKHKEE